MSEAKENKPGAAIKDKDLGQISEDRLEDVLPMESPDMKGEDI